jgi:hypothetical protein
MGILKFIFLVALLPASAFPEGKLGQILPTNPVDTAMNQACQIAVPLIVGQEVGAFSALKTFASWIIPSVFAVDKLEQVMNNDCEIAVPVVFGQEFFDEMAPYLKERGYYPYPVTDVASVEEGFFFDFTMRTEPGVIWDSHATLVHIRNKIKGKTFSLGEGRSTDNIKKAIKDLPNCRLAK